MCCSELPEPPAKFDMHFRRERLIAQKQHLMFNQRAVQRIDDFIDLGVAPPQRAIEVEVMHFSTQRWRPTLNLEIGHTPRVVALSTAC
jgi:hypothetical protein